VVATLPSRDDPVFPAVEGLKAFRAQNTDTLLRAAAVIERQVNHQSRLLDDLLDLSRIGQGKIELQPGRLDLVRLTRDVAEDRRGVLEAAGLTLGLDLPDRPVWVEGDATRLTQVVGNLLGNAAKFTPRGGLVAVAVSDRSKSTTERGRSGATGAGPRGRHGEGQRGEAIGEMGSREQSQSPHDPSQDDLSVLSVSPCLRVEIRSFNRGDGGAAGGVDAGDDAADGLIELAQEQIRVDADDEDQGDERRQDGNLAPCQIAQASVLRVIKRAFGDLLEHPEHVAGAQDHAGGADGGDDPLRGVLERAQQDQKLADEPIQARQADG
jgi:hypothetical protein